MSRADRRRDFNEATHVSRPLDEIEAKLNDHIILAAQDLRNLSRYPSGQELTRQSRQDAVERDGLDLLLHDLQVDLGHVNLLAELWREFGALEELRIHSGRHDGQNARDTLSTAMWTENERCSRDVAGAILLLKGRAADGWGLAVPRYLTKLGC